MQACFWGEAFSLHRHDTYAVGLTLFGVQRFRFRGQTWTCLPGQCHILHPDELHDGRAGTDVGFGYRMLYLDPALVREAVQQLPFVAEPVVDLRSCFDPSDAWVWEIDGALDDLAAADLVQTVSGALMRLSASSSRREPALSMPALQRVRERLAHEPGTRTSMEDLEHLSGLDRWTLARQFRAAFGTSPSRYRTQQQVRRARQLMGQGESLAQAAAVCGFADQSHLTRHFKGAFGLTPGRWAGLLDGRRAPGLNADASP